MERKQAIYEGDRSHEDLQFLYSLCLSYPGWENDVNTAIRYHEEGYDLGTYEKFSLIEKQNMHDGDRSHPRLIALDSCAFQLNYPGWKKDAKGIEDKHVGYFSSCEGVTKNSMQCFRNLSESNTNIAQA
jgi:hypothetical protein